MIFAQKRRTEDHLKPNLSFFLRHPIPRSSIFRPRRLFFARTDGHRTGCDVGGATGVGEVTTTIPSSAATIKETLCVSERRIIMDKLLEFGRRALFYVRVISGYEERRIRNYRLQLEQRLQQAQARKVALRKIPEQAILGEVRRMVEEMQTLNKKLEETEAAIEEYFKPIDKEAEIIMKMQLEGEEQTMKEMMAAMQRQDLLEKAEAERIGKPSNADEKQQNQDPESTTSRHAQMR